MGFEKGNTHGKGRPAGSQNKTTAQAKEMIQKISSELEQTLTADLQNLEPIERVKLWLSLQEYLTPKLSRQDINADMGEQGPPVFNIHVIGNDKPILEEPK